MSSEEGKEIITFGGQTNVNIKNCSWKLGGKDSGAYLRCYENYDMKKMRFYVEENFKSRKEAEQRLIKILGNP